MKYSGTAAPAILVTGVGAVIGQGIIKSLRSSGLSCRIIGIDSNPHSVGFHWSDIGTSVPRVDDPAWMNEIITLCNRYEIDLVLPGIEQDVRAFVSNRAEIQQRTGALVLLNSFCALGAGLDKWELKHFADEHDVLIPETMLAAEMVSLPGRYPQLLKPRYGMAGKGIFYVNSAEAMRERLQSVDHNEYLVQEYVGTDDEEYTVSVFGCAEGALTTPIMLRRKLNYGSTFEAETVFDDSLAALVLETAAKLSIIGPTNFQYRKVGDSYYLMEINPRFSSSTSIKSAFGFNEPAMAVQSFVLGLPVSPITIRAGRCLRYLEDNIEYL